MERTFKATLALAMITFATVAAPRAQASGNSILIRIDNSPNPTGRPTNTSSIYALQVVLDLSVSPYTRYDSINVSSVSGTIDRCIEDVNDHDIDAIKFIMGDGGADALWIDQWEVRTYASDDCSGTYTVTETYGVDNQNGYCFSTDPTKFSSYNPTVCDFSGSDAPDDFLPKTGSPTSYSMMEWNYSH